MRKCLHCNSEMIENCCPKIAASWTMTAVKDGFYGKNLGDISCAICPQCEYVEFYMKNIEKLKMK